MLVSTKGRYALRVAIDLAQHPEADYVSLKDISARQGISVKYLEMIVSFLVRGGVVTSRRGKEGGYRLSRPAADITAGEIVRMAEGSIAPVSCLEAGAGGCERAAGCLTLPMWQRLDALIYDYLNGISIKDLAEGKIKANGG